MILVLTKCDTLSSTAINILRNDGLSLQEARKEAPEYKENMLNELQGRIRQELGAMMFPPKDHLALAGEYIPTD